MAIQTYIIHRGNKNQKVRGEFTVVNDPKTGKVYLVGSWLMKTLHWTDRSGQRQVDELFVDTKLDITGCSLTIKG